MPGPLITLTTDFGASPYVAQMKGVLLSEVPDARIVDVTHDIPPQAIRHGEVWLRSSAFTFPLGTTHVVVVDPGVGTARRPLAVRLRGHTFVGPDNGVLGVMAHHPEAACVVLDRPEFFRQPVASTFHGRDIFAPVAAELASGVALGDVGSPISDPVASTIPAAARHGDTLIGQTLIADPFGNLLTNLPVAWVVGDASGWPGPADGGAAPRFDIAVDGHPVDWAKTYGAVAEGALLALAGSDGYVEIAVRGGSAADHFGDGHEDLTVRCTRKRPPCKPTTCLRLPQ